MIDRKAKIVATIGPSSNTETTMTRLIQSGIDVARLNFSHGTHEQHAMVISRLRQKSIELNKPVTILQDLQGPKLRVANLPAEGIRLQCGETVYLSSRTDKQQTDARVTFIPMDVPDLEQSVKAGNRILLDDGQMELCVTKVDHDSIEASVVTGGLLTSHKGVNLPGADLKIPVLSEKDRADLNFGLTQGVDVVAISFVKSADDIEEVRKAIRACRPDRSNTPIIAKLERPEAIENLHEIIHAADGVMVARGDLAVETSPSLVPIMQKQIIQMANKHSKMVITATQMLDSMIHNPRPTRAEASDVANAIFDGTDAVMLSGETASGEYPVESVMMMDSIVREAESHYTDWGNAQAFPEEPTREDAISMTRAARELAHDRNVGAIAVFTQTGHTALLMSKTRPRVPILAFTPIQETYQRLNMYWGVLPFLTPFASSVETMIAHVEKALVESTSLKPGQQVVLISGFPVGEFRLPNFALLHTIGEKV
jgi:pyruvate kinase